MCVPPLDRIRSIAADIFHVPEANLGPASSPDTIETWDSIQHLNMVLALEQEFNLQFTPEEIEEMLSLELIGLLVEEKVKMSGVAHVS